MRDRVFLNDQMAYVSLRTLTIKFGNLLDPNTLFG